MQETNGFQITLEKFYMGASPMAALDSLTEYGNSGHYSVAINVDVLNPSYLTQGPALAQLTDGNPTGAVGETIQFIMDKAVSADVSFAIGPTKLYKLTSTNVATGATGPAWPHAVTSSVEGESVSDLGGNLYYLYNRATGGDIGKYDLATTFNDTWGSVTGGTALQVASHPSAVKEDLLVFGNGRYLGVYINGSTYNAAKLDFGIGATVDDVIFHANQWWLAVNAGTTGTNRTVGHIYLYDGSATAAQLADETSVGYQRIGFLYPVNGIVYVAYQDLSSLDGYKIGYLAGRQIKPLASFSGSLPNFAQKTLYKSTILFLSSGAVYSAGATDDSLPVQLSQLADGGYSTVGAIAAPFGTPMVSSGNATGSYQIAKFSGYDTNCSWKSIIIPTTKGSDLGFIDKIIVFTNALGSGASCSLVLETNQGVTSSSAMTITTEGKTKHSFSVSISNVQDLRVSLNWSGGSSSNPVRIRKIVIQGHYTETV